jgi:hypothetical protein
MWCSSIETRYMPVLIISRRASPCVRLLSLATVLRAKIHINVALWLEKSIMLLPLPLTHILVKESRVGVMVKEVAEVESC